MSEKSKCVVCGYVCLADERQDKCPVCGVGQDKFITLPSPPPMVFIKGADADIERKEDELARPLFMPADAMGVDDGEIEIRCGRFLIRKIPVKPGEKVTITNENNFLLFIASGKVQLESDKGLDLIVLPPSEKSIEAAEETGEAREVDENVPIEEMEIKDAGLEEINQEEEPMEDKIIQASAGAMVLAPEKTDLVVTNNEESAGLILIVKSIF